MKSLLTDNELKIQFQIKDFVLKTQQQIAKDFYASGLFFEPHFETEEHSYDDILLTISFKLEEIMRLGESKLLQLLYQIDVSQALFLDIINSPHFISELGELIIKREAYKVYLRSQF